MAFNKSWDGVWRGLWQKTTTIFAHLSRCWFDVERQRRARLVPQDMVLLSSRPYKTSGFRLDSCHLKRITCELIIFGETQKYVCINIIRILYMYIYLLTFSLHVTSIFASRNTHHESSKTKTPKTPLKGPCFSTSFNLPFFFRFKKTNKSPCAVSTRYFNSSGVPERLAGEKKEVTSKLTDDPWIHPIFDEKIALFSSNFIHPNFVGKNTHFWSKTLPRKLTWNLKIATLKRKIIFQTSILGFHVCFRGCTSPLFCLG